MMQVENYQRIHIHLHRMKTNFLENVKVVITYDVPQKVL